MFKLNISIKQFIWVELIAILFGLPLSSCNSLIQPINSTPTLNSSSTQTPIPTSALTITTPATQPEVLRLWLPPQWDPNSNSNGGRLLEARLNAFQAQFPDFPMEIRIKANDGVGGMLDSLTTASSAAPSALPDLVLLSRPLLETAAQKGILHPLNSATKNPDEGFWYPYAHQISMVQNTNYGVPFIGDLLILAYSQSLLSAEIPKEWNHWLSSPYTLGFNAADPQASVLLALYLLAGGSFQDDQGYPKLDADILTKVIEDIAVASRQGKIPQWVAQADNTQLIMDELEKKQVDFLYLWSSTFLQGNHASWNILPGFYQNNQTICLANGWIWASSSPQANKIGISFQLANFLSDKEFLAELSENSAGVPTQPAALSLWNDKELAVSLDTISKVAQSIPTTGISSTISPALHNALMAVLKDHTPVPQAVSDALASMNKP